MLEAVLTDVLAFIEMSGTVQTNNYHQTNIAECSNQSLQEPGLVAESERLENAEVSEAVPPIQPNREKRLLSVTVPPNRSKELKVIENEIRRIEMELKKFQKCSKKHTEVSTVPNNYDHHRDTNPRIQELRVQ